MEEPFVRQMKKKQKGYDGMQGLKPEGLRKGSALLRVIERSAFQKLNGSESRRRCNGGYESKPEFFSGIVGTEGEKVSRLWRKRDEGEVLSAFGGNRRV